MGLVDYSDSDNDADDAKPEAMPPANKKRKTAQASQDGPSELPPLPSAFRDLYSSNVRTSVQDDPTLHGGRQRVVPHVEGNWPTHVFIEWLPDQIEQYALEQAMHFIENGLYDASHPTLPPRKATHSLLRNDLGVPVPLHVSLSRTLMLQTEQRSAFLDRCKTAASSVTAFDMDLGTLQWHPNEDRTRWFLVVQVSSPNGELSDLLHSLNGVASAYGQPLLYTDDVLNAADSPSVSASTAQGEPRSPTNSNKFHISLAWSLEAPADSDGTSAAMLLKSKTYEGMLTNILTKYRVPAKDFKIRIGQDVTTIPLRERRESVAQAT